MSEYIVEVTGQIPDAIYERELIEIVRCRDCVDANKVETRFSGEQYACMRFEDYTVEPDGFCAWGERRES